ncbi:hypothetical protein BOX15_Mlig008975g1 [Macrostomum lignano]|uniref:Uncharacterized protein n=1 Tax=Macrostomum lignano TaxID=282301 RepID=A0A267G3M4_9PLAT|nr:hypothetical protein BOX15_Mlig008975g1 [Macrostomum lignano]
MHAMRLKRPYYPLLAALAAGWLMGALTVLLLLTEREVDLVPPMPDDEAVWPSPAIDPGNFNCDNRRRRPLQPTGDFAAGMAWQRMRQNDSIYYFERPGKLLPMLRPLSEKEASATYRASVARSWLGTQTLVIAATVRNGMPNLENSLQNIGRLRTLFRQSWVLLVENDSDDGTRERLLRLARLDPRVRVLGCGQPNSKSPCRMNQRYHSGSAHRPGSNMERTIEEEIDRGLIMSVLRNEYLNHAYKHLGSSADFLLIIDPDLAWHSWNLNSILQGLYYFKTRPKLQQMCASTVSLYDGKLYDPCTINFYNNKRYGEDTKYPYVDIEKSILKGPRDLPPVKTESCFQAFSFYRFSVLQSRRLQYERSHGEWMCEHNTLSRQLDEVYLDPQMRLGVSDSANYYVLNRNLF